jgi:hypothetical protein
MDSSIIIAVFKIKFFIFNYLEILQWIVLFGAKSKTPDASCV